ncbi:hypothetical protein NL533_35165, partial [Klebsiella pneumoniae]|nr:hypothetical protein [Klebsiella pneumoniae]
WVDGRKLESVDDRRPPGASSGTGTPAGVSASLSTSGRALLGWSKQVVVAGRTIDVGLPVIGAAATLLGSMLDWFSAPGVS